MVLISSKMNQLGKKAPSFSLINPVTNQMQSLDELKSETATVIMVICNHCPYVIHLREGLIDLAIDYSSQGISFIAINANDAARYPDDSPEQMKVISQKFAYPFPYLFDETQEVAKAYGAECTPDFFVYDKNLTCVYNGQLDDSRPNNDLPVTGESIRNVLDQIISNEDITVEQKPSIGCSIKWK